MSHPVRRGGHPSKGGELKPNVNRDSSIPLHFNRNGKDINKNVPQIAGRFLS